MVSLPAPASDTVLSKTAVQKNSRNLSLFPFKCEEVITEEPHLSRCSTSRRQSTFIIHLRFVCLFNSKWDLVLFNYLPSLQPTLVPAIHNLIHTGKQNCFRSVCSRGSRRVVQITFSCNWHWILSCRLCCFKTVIAWMTKCLKKDRKMM